MSIFLSAHPLAVQIEIKVCIWVERRSDKSLRDRSQQAHGGFLNAFNSVAVRPWPDKQEGSIKYYDDQDREKTLDAALKRQIAKYTLLTKKPLKPEQLTRYHDSLHHATTQLEPYSSGPNSFCRWPAYLGHAFCRPSPREVYMKLKNAAGIQMCISVRHLIAVVTGTRVLFPLRQGHRMR